MTDPIPWPAPASPGDPITAEGWNELQNTAQANVEQVGDRVSVHDHSGADQGPLLTGASIDPTSGLNVAALEVTGDVDVSGALRRNGEDVSTGVSMLTVWQASDLSLANTGINSTTIWTSIGALRIQVTATVETVLALSVAGKAISGPGAGLESQFWLSTISPTGQSASIPLYNLVGGKLTAQVLATYWDISAVANSPVWSIPLGTETAIAFTQTVQVPPGTYTVYLRAKGDGRIKNGVMTAVMMPASPSTGLAIPPTGPVDQLPDGGGDTRATA